MQLNRGEEILPNYWTEEKIKKYLDEEKGKGEKGSYKSWLTIDDMPKNFKGELVLTSAYWFSNDIRTVNLIGNLDVATFYAMQWNKNIIDIREYYPLERTETMQIANELKISHQKDKTTKIPTVMVSNFLVTYKKEGAQLQQAIITGWSEQSASKRFVNQLRIYEKYWSSKGVEVKLITENDINWTAARNYNKLAHMRTANHYILTQEECNFTVNQLSFYQKNCPTITISEFARTISNELSLTPGQIQCALDFLIANCAIEFSYTTEEYTYDLQINKLNIKHTKFKVGTVLRPPRAFEDTIITF